MSFYVRSGGARRDPNSISLPCVLVFFLWAKAGVPFHFCVVWHLMISTLAAVISIIMLFVIQNSQNRHTIAIQLKLDEIIRATKGAHNEMMDIEKLTDEDLARIRKKVRLAGGNNQRRPETWQT